MGTHGLQTTLPLDPFQGLLLKLMIIGELLRSYTRGFHFWFHGFSSLKPFFFFKNCMILMHTSLFESFGQIRLLRFERKNWRPSYNSLIVLEHLLTHGPGSVAGEFQTDKDVIREMESFQCIDERGYGILFLLVFMYISVILIIFG